MGWSLVQCSPSPHLGVKSFVWAEVVVVVAVVVVVVVVVVVGSVQ